MTSGFEVRRLQDEQEAADFAQILAWAFSVKPAEAPRWIEHSGPENVRIVLREGRVAGGLFLLPMGQWFGGRSVRMVGIAGVAVAPEHRGRGAGAALMRHVVWELAEHQVALSTLYPAAMALYRSVGYERAGSRFAIRMRPADIGLSDRELSVTPIGDADQAKVEEAYRSFASLCGGYLDRNRNLWSRVRQPGPDPARGFLVRRKGVVEGYLYAAPEHPDERARYSMKLTDIVALTPYAGRRLLTLLSEHRSLVTEVTWYGGCAGMVLSLLPEQAYRIALLDHFATRIVDVQLALAGRGYPPFEAELELEVIDSLLKQNQDRFVLQTSGGTGTVRRGGRGKMRVHVRGLAPMFTGFLSPQELQRAGVVQGPERTLATAAALFAGPAPCMPDTF